MANTNPPKRGQAFNLEIALDDFNSPGSIKTTPTIAAGDFKVSKDGGALANLTTLPSETVAASGIVLIPLSATEMTADRVTIRCVDQTSPKEWADKVIYIPTTA